MAAALTFPVAIPDTLIIAGLQFQPQPMQEITPSRGGNSQAADLGPELWSARYESGLLAPAAYGEALAWAHTILTSDKFIAYDPMWDYPLLYPNGWGNLKALSLPFDGTGKIQSINADNKRLTIYNLPSTVASPSSSFTLSKGDMLSFDYGSSGQRALHRVVNGDTTNATGVLTVEVRPSIRTGAAVDNIVQLYRPSCLMNIVPGSYSERRVSKQIGGYLTFDAIQVSP